MLPGLRGMEFGRLRMSVGHGRNKRGRPLSPIEVGRLLGRARSAGASIQDCARALKLTDSQVSHFLRVLELPADIRHLVAWGRSSDSIGFTTAVQITRIADPDDQRALGTAVIEQRLRMDEVRQVVQLGQRSRRPLEERLQEVLGMRPTVVRHYVFIGTVADGDIEAALEAMTQTERDALLRSSLDALDLQDASGRLGEKFFALVGGDRLRGQLTNPGQEITESRLRACLAEKVKKR